MRFTIRDLLWLTLVAALGLAWWLHHRAWVQKYSATADERELWQARTEELHVQRDILAEQLNRYRARQSPGSTAPQAAEQGTAE